MTIRFPVVMSRAGWIIGSVATLSTIGGVKNLVTDRGEATSTARTRSTVAPPRISSTVPKSTTSTTVRPSTTSTTQLVPSFDLGGSAACGMAASTRVGMTGPDVRCLETRLAAVSTGVASFVVDDVFGRDTDQVIRQFQAANGLEADGIVGRKTATVLGIWSPPPPKSPTPKKPGPSKPVSTKPASTKRNCTPGYSPCLPRAADYDCLGGSGNGPKYTGRVRVTGADIYGLDRDRDGIGCE